MSRAKKKHLKRFRTNAYKWASNFEEFGKEELKEIRQYLDSDEFFEDARAIANKYKTQKEINQEVTVLFSKKLDEMLSKVEHKNALDNILQSININTTG